MGQVQLYSRRRIRKIEYKQCDEFREESFERTIALKPDIVILVAGVDPGMRVFDRDSETLLTVKESAPVVLAGWRETIERFTSKGIEVVVVPGWARAPHDPVTCLLDSRDARECSFEFNAAFAAAAPARVAAEGVSGAEALSLDHRICTDGLCNVIKGSTLVYYDSVHVTRLFAEEFVPDFRELLHRHK